LSEWVDPSHYEERVSADGNARFRVNVRKPTS